MHLFASFEQKLKLKQMPKLGFPNCFTVNKIKENVTQAPLTKSCVTWWLKHLDASMRSWVQIHLTHVHQYMNFYTWWCIGCIFWCMCMCVHMV